LGFFDVLQLRVKDISKPKRRTDMSGSNINSVSIVGNLGAAPVVGQSQNGVDYAQFNLACNQSWRVKGGDLKKRTDWFRVVAFNGLAKTLARLDKGDQVAVSGRLQSQTYEKDGVSRTVVEIVATTVQFLRLKDRAAAGEGEDAGATGVEPLGAGYDDDIPF
jgi:single-strand DNA-binding protein